MGIHEVEYSIVDKFSVLKAICMEVEAVEVITGLDAFIVIVDICMTGKMDGTMSFQLQWKAPKVVLDRRSKGR